jgi:hypothetical protein
MTYQEDLHAFRSDTSIVYWRTSLYKRGLRGG